MSILRLISPKQVVCGFSIVDHETGGDWFVLPRGCKCKTVRRFRVPEEDCLQAGLIDQFLLSSKYGQYKTMNQTLSVAS